MLRLISKLTASPGDLLRVLRAYLWLFRAKRLMNRATGTQWLFGETQADFQAEKNLKTSEEDWMFIKRRVAAVSRASRYPYPWALCLQRSLALREWLAKDDFFTEVRYGVKRDGAEFAAHAWVVYDGKIINDSVNHVSTFVVLKSLDEYGKDSRSQLQTAIVTSRTESESSGTPV